MKLPRVYPVVDSASWVERLVSLGVRLVQLRIKDRSEDELRSEIRDAKKLCEQADAQLIVNDYWQLAMADVISCTWDKAMCKPPTYRRFARQVSGSASVLMITSSLKMPWPSSPSTWHSVRSIPRC